MIEYQIGGQRSLTPLLQSLDLQDRNRSLSSIHSGYTPTRRTSSSTCHDGSYVYSRSSFRSEPTSSGSVTTLSSSSVRERDPGTKEIRRVTTSRDGGLGMGMSPREYHSEG